MSLILIDKISTDTPLDVMAEKIKAAWIKGATKMIYDETQSPGEQYFMLYSWSVLIECTKELITVNDDNSTTTWNKGMMYNRNLVESLPYKTAKEHFKI